PRAVVRGHCGRAAGLATDRDADTTLPEGEVAVDTVRRAGEGHAAIGLAGDGRRRDLDRVADDAGGRRATGTAARSDRLDVRDECVEREVLLAVREVLELIRSDGETRDDAGS